MRRSKQNSEQMKKKKGKKTITECIKKQRKPKCCNKNVTFP